ncbi:MAG: T9SS type B sorting domain-containing protein [Flavobacteriales bacterium]|nr:T9SS type B sorting domain-containing protein [Flavobacteriales bacterium]
MLRTVFFILLFWGVLLSNIDARAGNIEFIENGGQWPEQVLYKVGLSTGGFYLEKGGFMYSLMDLQAIREAHDHHTPFPETIQAHAFRMTFVNANTEAATKTTERSTNYRNYYLGNDPTKWASKVYAYQTVQYVSLYDGIDLKVYSNGEHLKYDLMVAPNADLGQLQMHYEGLDGMRILENGDLELSNSVVNVFEKKPVAYQMIGDERVEVPCAFELNGETVTFIFPEGYDPTRELIIDPELVFASFTGSTTDNFGSSATFDNSGYLYGAGTSFGDGYPVTTGAYSQPAAGHTDIGISKFSPDGSSLAYSTFIGGSNAESVNSLIVNGNNELYILGTSSSLDYPISNNAFQTTNGRGPSVNWTVLPQYNYAYGYGIDHDLGCDIVITRLAADGSAILSSTFVGGTLNDGLNPNTILYYNYGDPFRGEINLDDAGNVYVASSTESTDFPVTSGAVQTTNAGGRDGVVFKMNPNLSNMIWSTYVGGSSTDNAYSIQFDQGGSPVIAGGTLSSDFPTTSGSLHPTYGGQGDGWVMKLAANGSSITASSYIGTDKYDQAYFVQIDPDNNVFLLGQSLGNMPITPASVYHNNNSCQFIQKLDNSLSNLLVSSTIGTGRGVIDFSPTAFLVSNCYQIFVSGWGGATNHVIGNAVQSSTVGLPITSDAHQSTSDGSDFYLMMLEEDVAALTYGTFFGGPVSEEHVDGGTSRFDKNGIVYEAVCAGCDGHSDFPTTPGAWSNTNNSSNCNLGVFKFNLNQIIAVPDFYLNLQNCDFPMEVDFTNQSTGANTFLWTFGDGETSSYFEGNHYYTDPGHYEISLYASDSAGCLVPDTGYVEFDIPEPPVISVFGGDTICARDTVPLGVEGIGIVSYEWNPAATVDDPSSTQPNASPSETTAYLVTATDSVGCTVTDTVLVVVSEPPYLSVGDDAYLEPGVNGSLTASVQVGSTIEWSPTEGLSCITCPDPIANPEETTTYYITITDELGCTNIDSIIVYAYPTIYVPNAFTPGGNEKNPIFYAYGRGIADFTLTIFNRWGQMIFQSNELDKGWDGTMNGRDVQTGVYVWTLQYTTDIAPMDVHKKIGTVTLLRNVY